MLKRIVVAVDFSQFAVYCRNRKYKRDETAFYTGNENNIRGLDRNIPIHWLDDWWYSRRITVGDYLILKAKFRNHKDVDERMIHSEGIQF